MRVRALDPAGDWTFGKGQNNYLRDNDAIRQSIQTRLMSFLGDCFWDVAAGINWWARLGSKDKILTELDIAATILNTQGVQNLGELSAEIDPKTRGLSTQWQVTTTFSALELGTVQGATSFLLTQDGVAITTQDGTPISI